MLVKTFKTWGITNRVSENRYVPFFDVDFESSKDLSVVGEFIDISEKYELGRLLVFSTQHGYHVVSLRVVKWQTLKKILKDAPVDPLFREKTFKQKYSVLRQGAKFDYDERRIINSSPFYLFTLPAENQHIPMSLGHYKFFKYRYKIPKKVMPKGFFVKNSSKVELIYYKTLKR